MNTAPLSPDRSARCRLRLQGRVSADWTDWLADITVAYVGDHTHITGILRDQPALFGLLSFIRDLGAPLLLVEYIPDKEFE